jgi:hypothetical protein
MGTNRMSAKPRDGVVNRFGQTHDIKNLLLVPMLWVLGYGGVG